jgi:hypothetical protein
MANIIGRAPKMPDGPGPYGSPGDDLTVGPPFPDYTKHSPAPADPGNQHVSESQPMPPSPFRLPPVPKAGFIPCQGAYTTHLIAGRPLKELRP